MLNGAADRFYSRNNFVSLLPMNPEKPSEPEWEDPTFYHFIRDLFDAGRLDDVWRLYDSVKASNDSGFIVDDVIDWSDVNRWWGLTDQQRAWMCYYAVLEARTDILIWFAEGNHGYSNYIFPDGRTLMHVVVANELWEVAQDIVWYGGDVDEEDKFDDTIYNSCPGGAQGAFAVRLKSWISQFYANNVPTETGLELMSAIGGNDEIKVTILLQRGASPNSYQYRVRKACVWPKTALMQSVELSNANIVRQLIDAGANVNQIGGATGFPPIDSEGYYCKVTALTFASWGGHKEIVRLLVASGSDVNLTADGGITPLMCATFCQYHEIAAYLIECGADVNALYNGGYSALFFAIEQTDRALIQLLLNSGALQVGRLERDREGIIMWHWHANRDRNTLRKHFETYDMLPIMYPEPVSERDKSRTDLRESLSRFLHSAAAFDDIDVISWLLLLGIPVDGLNDCKSTLCTAAKMGSLNAAKFLISKGAKTNPRGGCCAFGDPLILAAEHGHLELLDYLIRVELNRGKLFALRLAGALRMAIFRSQADSVGVLLSSGANPNQCPPYDATPLLAHALDNEDDAIARMLLQAGAVPLPDHSPSRRIKVGMKFNEIVDLLPEGGDIDN